MQHERILGRYRGRHVLRRGVDGLCLHPRAHRLRPRQPVRPDALSIARSGSATCSIARPAWSTCRSWRSLQNGTAFFASSSLIAIGGGLALLRATNDARGRARRAADRSQPLARSVGNQMRRADPDFHLRLLQILLGLSAVQLRRDPARRDAAGLGKRHARKRKPMSSAPRGCSNPPGQHFNRGQRSFFFALGYLGWFVSPWVLFVTTAMVVIVTWRRQFASQCVEGDGKLREASSLNVIVCNERRMRLCMRAKRSNPWSFAPR